MVFCFVQKFFFGQFLVRILFFFVAQEFNIRLYDKNSESDYFFFLHQNQNIFFSNIGNQNIFLETPPPPPLQVKWSFSYFFSLLTRVFVYFDVLTVFWGFICGYFAEFIILSTISPLVRLRCMFLHSNFQLM
jgi:hypothetical protein